MGVVKLNLSNISFGNDLSSLDKIVVLLDSNDFYEFIAKKMKQTVEEITARNLNADEDQKYIHLYRKQHQTKIEKNKVIVFNETIASVDEVSEKLRANYPNGFDLAKAVEYGVGKLGSQSEASGYAGEDSWEYMVNPERNYDKPWKYVRNGQEFWTRGMSGKLIYTKSQIEIEKNMSKWINEYISKKIGG